MTTIAPVTAVTPSQPQPTQSTAAFARIERALERVTRTRARKGLPAPQIAVCSPRGDLAWGDQDQAFLAASITKLFTGVIVLQLAESGRLALDTRVDALLPAETIAGLFRADAPAPTVLDLLQHRSGAADYFEGTRRASVLAELLRDPQRTWTPSDLLEFSRTHQAPVGRPGERFRYSDTGFVVLGLIIEELTGREFHDVVHEQIIEPLELTRTFLPRLTEPAEGDSAVAPVYIAGQELSTAPGLSCAWAGGAIASTTSDLLAFSEALHSGRLISDEHLRLMATPTGRVRAGIHYGAAMMELRFEGFSPLLRGQSRPLGHLGSTGTSLCYDPASRTHVAMNFHAREEMPRLIRTAIAIHMSLR